MYTWSNWPLGNAHVGGSVSVTFTDPIPDIDVVPGPLQLTRANPKISSPVVAPSQTPKRDEFERFRDEVSTQNSPNVRSQRWEAASDGGRSRVPEL